VRPRIHHRKIGHPNLGDHELSVGDGQDEDEHLGGDEDDRLGENHDECQWRQPAHAHGNVVTFDTRELWSGRDTMVLTIAKEHRCCDCPRYE
jgi:hypothetical protein